MNYKSTISLNCPHCSTKTQFIQQHHDYCASDLRHHICFKCTNCKGLIVSIWSSTTNHLGNFESNPRAYDVELQVYYPIVGDWMAKINLDSISDIDVKEDFIEAINCYNNGFYKSSMIMARRSIQQEMENKKATGKNLYEQIESMGISSRLKGLLHKVKNFGNYGAHPDFFLFDNDGNKIEDKKAFAKLSLEFLDRYFSDEYEIDSLINGAPRSKKEMESDNA